MSDQLEHGYTRIAHTLLEKLARANMPANSFRITLWAIRNTYGYNRKETKKATIRDIAEDVQMPVGSVHLAMQYLLGIEVLVKTENGGFFFNKRNIGVQPTEQPNLFSPLNKTVQPTEHFVQPAERRECNYRKDNLKETLNTGRGGFDSFWKAYPKKFGRAAALAAWQKKNPPLDKCLKTLKWQTASEQWTKNGGTFIPKAASWIMDGCWDDVPLTHDLVTCQKCGHEGALKKNHSGPVVCGRCGSAVKPL